MFHEGWGMSSIDSLVERIARDRRLRGIQFTSRELNDLADIYIPGFLFHWRRPRLLYALRE